MATARFVGQVISRHIPLFAYYRRAGSASQASFNPSSIREKRRRLLAEHVPRVYPGAVWTAKVPRARDPLASSSVWITDLRGRPAPRLLVVIPFKDQVETTIKCLESIERQEHAPGRAGRAGQQPLDEAQDSAPVAGLEG